MTQNPWVSFRQWPSCNFPRNSLRMRILWRILQDNMELKLSSKEFYFLEFALINKCLWWLNGMKSRSKRRENNVDLVSNTHQRRYFHFELTSNWEEKVLVVFKQESVFLVFRVDHTLFWVRNCVVRTHFLLKKTIQWP